MPTPDATLPPHSPEAEAGVLGCILTPGGADGFDDCQARLKAGPKEFYDARHQVIYAALCALRQAGNALDTLTLQSELQRRNEIEAAGGFAYFDALPDQVPSAANLPYYLEIVHERYLLRRLLWYCTFTSKAVHEHQGAAVELLGKVQTAFANLESDYTDETSDGKTCATAMIDDLENRRALHDAGKHSGILTGFWRLDQMTDGLQPGELSIIAARPSIGKTAIILDLVRRACLWDGVPTLIITLEMSRNALMRRMASAHCAIPLRELKHGLFTEGQMKSLMGFTSSLNQHPLYVEDGVKGMTIAELTARARRTVRKHGVKLIVVDYLQKIRPDRTHEKRTYEVAQASEGLKVLAGTTGAAVVSAAQLNREPEKDKGRLPKLADLADCGQIERDADFVGLLHRSREPGNTEAKLIVAKQRDGETGVIDLFFRGEYCRFENPPIATPDQETKE